jgi:SM-20-related protein
MLATNEITFPPSGDAECVTTRRHRIGNREILVLDGLFPADVVLSLHTFLARLPYRLDDVDSAETAYSRHWKAELPLAMAMGAPVLKKCAALVSEVDSSVPLRLWRIHSNLHLYGDMQFPHFDRVDGVTVLYYANSEWNEKWMGETIFYDDSRDPVYAVAPKPGRVVIFHGGILHRAGVPSRECYQARISIALKFEPVPASV